MAGQPKARVKKAAAARGPVERRSAPAWQNEALIDAICDDLQGGCSMETTGLAHGLGHSTLGKWAKEAADAATTLADEPDADVRTDPAKLLVGVRLLRAHAGASQDLERKLHMGEAWALEILARRHRATWGRQDTIKVGADETHREVATLLGALATTLESPT